MKYKLILTWTICITLYMPFPALYATNNQTVLSTDDTSAATYSYGTNPTNSEVVIGWASSGSPPAQTVSTKVKLTTTCDAGDSVTLNVNNYHCSSGVSMASGFPTGIGTAKEIAEFNFDSTTIGKTNTITIDPPLHTTPGTGGGSPVICNGPPGTPGALANEGGIKFTICIPNVTLTDTISVNVSNEFFHIVYITVGGLDDLSQIRFQQWVTSTTKFTDTNGAVSYPGGTYNNYNGWDGGESSPVAVTNPQADTHAIILRKIFTTGAGDGTPRTIEFCKEVYRTVQMFDYVTRASDSTKQVAELNWGYQCGNDNNLITPPLLPSPYTIASLIQIIVPSGSPACKFEVNNTYGGLPLTSP